MVVSNCMPFQPAPAGVFVHENKHMRSERLANVFDVGTALGNDFTIFQHNYLAIAPADDHRYRRSPIMIVSETRQLFALERLFCVDEFIFCIFAQHEPGMNHFARLCVA